jgi:F-box protein, helicase, 18
MIQLTPEQQKILASNGNIKINAIAGSGKTTTIIQYAKTRKTGSRILYIAFNKSVKQEAELKFKEHQIHNVTIETAHSLAYKYVMYGSNYKLKNEYQSYELMQLLDINTAININERYIICNHILKFAAYFCNSNALKIADLNYLDVVNDLQAKALVRHHYKLIAQCAREFLAKMLQAKIEITHDFYLKLFQLKCPQLPYDYILFDEGQDASPAMLDIFTKQNNAIKVIVGDTHQQIYSWRFAVNSLEQIDFENFYLSNSFRFDAHTALLAREILEWKSIFSTYKKTEINGLGKFEKIETYATLARTNLGLLKKAIDYMSLYNNKNAIYFEGNFNSYTYADEGASLYDILNLYNGKHDRINHSLIKSMNSIADLQEYIDKTEDRQLGMMLDLVFDYENEIFDIIKNIKAKHVTNKYEAKMIFSTIHRCKGMEYDHVELADDFITEEKIERLKEDCKKDEGLLKKMIEEVNLLYVAVTRAKKILQIPEVLLPIGFVATENIIVLEKIEVPKPESKEKYIKPIAKINPKLVVSFDANRTKRSHTKKDLPAESHQPWSRELDAELIKKYEQLETYKSLAEYFGRSQGAIRSRLRKLGLEE